MANNHGISVLVVEDESDLIALYRQFLDPDYEVRTAQTGADALSTMDGRVDVLLLDRHLPDRSGDDVLHTVRGRGHDVPVAMVSAIEPDLDILELPIDAYVTKPVGREQLNDTVRRMVAMHDVEDDHRELHRLRTKRRVLTDTQSSAIGSDRFDTLTRRLGELEDHLA